MLIQKSTSKIIFNILILFLIGLIVLIYIANREIQNKSKRFIYSNIQKVPRNDVGLVLGTSKYLQGHQLNPYFYNRILAAVMLFKANKIKYIIVSGDNKYMSYNEPMTMKRELIKYGIPSKKIFLDYAGFRTFDSVIRCHEIFSQSSFTIITQKFHLERAIYISHQYGIGAIGFEAKDVGFMLGLKTQVREYFARIKVFLDFYTNESPKFLGKKINIQ